MTLLDIRQAANLLVSFEESKRRSGQLYGRTEEVSRLLGNLSGMQQIRRTLEYVLEDMKEEYQLMNHFSECLEETCKAFTRYEEEITDFAEEMQRTQNSNLILKEINIPENIFALLR